MLALRPRKYCEILQDASKWIHPRSSKKTYSLLHLMYRFPDFGSQKKHLTPPSISDSDFVSCLSLKGSWLWPNLLSWNVERLELENDGIFPKEKSSIFCRTSFSASIEFQGLYLPWTPEPQPILIEFLFDFLKNSNATCGSKKTKNENFKVVEPTPLKSMLVKLDHFPT